MEFLFLIYSFATSTMLSEFTFWTTWFQNLWNELALMCQFQMCENNMFVKHARALAHARVHTHIAKIQTKTPEMDTCQAKGRKWIRNVVCTRSLTQLPLRRLIFRGKNSNCAPEKQASFWPNQRAGYRVTLDVTAWGHNSIPLFPARHVFPESTHEETLQAQVEDSFWNKRPTFISSDNVTKHRES